MRLCRRFLLPWLVPIHRDYELPMGEKFEADSYPWGVIEVDNEEHCDFVKLRQMLIRTHMEELKETYEQCPV